MEKQKTKPRRKFWKIAAPILALVYVLSSGPAMTLGMNRQRHDEEAVGPDGTARIQATSHVGPGLWWYAAYAPLIWFSGTSWGEPLASYWDSCMDSDS